MQISLLPLVRTLVSWTRFVFESLFILVFMIGIPSYVLGRVGIDVIYNIANFMGDPWDRSPWLFEWSSWILLFACFGIDAVFVFVSQKYSEDSDFYKLYSFRQIRIFMFVVSPLILVLPFTLPFVGFTIRAISL